MKDSPTDTDRLDHLERLKMESAQQDWVGVLYDGMLCLDEPRALKDKYDLASDPMPTIRSAIDASIAAGLRRKAAR